MRRTLTTRRPGRLLAVIATLAIAAAATGCGINDPMADQGATTAAAGAPSSSVPAASDDARAAAQRFADAYLALLNGGGAPAEQALHAAAGAELADGLILANQDARLAGDASTTASTRAIAVTPAATGHWRATFATGTTRWAMVLKLSSSSAAAPIVTEAATEPAE